MKTYIYALGCPKTLEVRYLGKSQNPQKRYIAHVSAALRGVYDHHTARWIRRLAAEGLKPVLRVLEEVPEGKCWREAERWWIAEGLNLGWPLTNSTAGGDGLSFLTLEDEQRYKERHSRAMTAYLSTPKGQAHFLKFRTAATTEEALAKRIQSVRQVTRSEHYREKMRTLNAEINARPEVRALKSEKTKSAWKSETRQKWLEAYALPETKAKQSEARKKAWADPETKKVMQDARWTEERRKAQALALDARREKMLAARTPESRAKQGAKLKEWHAKRRLEQDRVNLLETAA